MAKIFIDAGHGGNDPGASGCGLVEKTITLAVSKRVQYHLGRHGVVVVMSRTGDTNPSLTQRSNIANSNGVDASISIHCNAFNGAAYGVETYTYGTGSNEIRLANCVHNKIINDKLYNFNRGVKQGNLHMVREPQMAAILVEMAFIDNQSDASLLKSKQEEFAIAISKGLLEYVGISWKGESTASKPSTPSGELYRVRKSWSDAASQIGAYSDLNNAKAICDKNPGYSVFNSAGTKVYPVSVPSTPSGCDTELQRYTEYGVCTITTPDGIYFRNKPCTHCGTRQGTYNYRESVNYDLVVITKKYVWISWVSASAGVRRYMPITDRSNGEKWATCV